ncbi:MAG: hypothetical protein IPJ74_06135 [Saprospiraceae bacterium]|nr:hypothetical protein [Saprospiraceae bacterium]
MILLSISAFGYDAYYDIYAWINKKRLTKTQQIQLLQTEGNAILNTH